MDQTSPHEQADPVGLNGHLANGHAPNSPTTGESTDPEPHLDPEAAGRPEAEVSDEAPAVDPLALLDDQYLTVLAQAEVHAEELQRETLRAREQALELRAEFATAQAAVDDGRAELARRLDEVDAERDRLEAEVEALRADAEQQRVAIQAQADQESEALRAEADGRREEIRRELDTDEAALAEARQERDRLETRVRELSASQEALLSRLLDTRTRLADYLPAIEEASRAHEALDAVLRSALAGVTSSAPAAASTDGALDGSPGSAVEGTDPATDTDPVEATPVSTGAQRRPLGRILHSS